MNNCNRISGYYWRLILPLLISVLFGCSPKQRNPYSILKPQYERVTSPAGLIEASALKRDATGVFDVIIFLDSQNAIYNSADDFPGGITPSDSLDIYWNEHRLIFLRDGTLVGEWVWNENNKEIQWRARSKQ